MEERESEARSDVTPPELVTAETIMVRAVEVFGSSSKATHWLHRRNWLFQGRTPLQTLREDPASVEAELVRIEHGVYV